MNKIIKKISILIITMIVIFQYSYVFAFSKNETVFVDLDSNGNMKKTIVNNQLMLNENERNSNIEDNSELEKIVNLNGEESFNIKGNLMQWETLTKDIYYQGVAEKTLPISINVKYYLNEEEKKLEEIDGKSGKVTIELKFTNNLKNDVKINGKNKTLYTPFVVLCGTILSDDKNSEIEVTNGKVADTGTKSLIAAISSPGLYESLELDELKNLDTVKISFKTTNFDKSSTIYIAATPKLIEETDLKIFDKMDELTDNLKKLQNNMNTIEDGAKKLNDGANSLKNGTESLATGANTLKEGTSTLANGAKDLKAGATNLAEGASKLENGASSVADGINSISDNIKLIAQSVEQLETGSKSLDAGIEQIISEIEKLEKKLSSVEIQTMLKDLNALKQKNDETIKTIEDGYKTYNLSVLSIDTIMSLEYDNATKAKLITVKNNYESGMTTLLKGNSKSLQTILSNVNTVSGKLNELKAGLEAVKSGSSQISGGLTTLKTGINKLYNGSIELSNGASTLKNGVSTLSNGANNLKTGANSLSDGVNTLKNGASTLSNGATELNVGANSLVNGSKELASGIEKFNKEGINKLSSYSDKINDYNEIIKQLIKLSENYHGFSCNNATITNFVYIVD